MSGRRPPKIAMRGIMVCHLTQSLHNTRARTRASEIRAVAYSCVTDTYIVILIAAPRSHTNNVMPTCLAFHFMHYTLDPIDYVEVVK